MKYLIRPADLEPYSPANHTGTRNVRLVASSNLEVVLGEVERGKGALPHAHPGIEQVCYLLEGSAHVEIACEKFEMRAGEACFFPADQPHLFQATSERVRVLVIYSPPYLENPANVRR
ncbi:MAG TPA: cupin domain-containing protein [Burkholderiales bacterium]|nr:cupin domain-containing protein [Burkholderiales bacterium]